MRLVEMLPMRLIIITVNEKLASFNGSQKR